MENKDKYKKSQWNDPLWLFENQYFDFIIPFYLNMRSIVYSCNDRTYTECEYCDISRLNKKHRYLMRCCNNIPNQPCKISHYALKYL